MTRDSSPEVRAIVNELAACETREEVEDGIDRLQLTLEAERAAAEANDRERRRKTGAVRIMPAGTAERARSQFTAIIERAKAERDAGQLDGDEEPVG